MDRLLELWGLPLSIVKKIFRYHHEIHMVCIMDECMVLCQLFGYRRQTSFHVYTNPIFSRHHYARKVDNRLAEFDLHDKRIRCRGISMDMKTDIFAMYNHLPNHNYKREKRWCDKWWFIQYRIENELPFMSYVKLRSNLMQRRYFNDHYHK